MKKFKGVCSGIDPDCEFFQERDTKIGRFLKVLIYSGDEPTKIGPIFTKFTFSKINYVSEKRQKLKMFIECKKWQN